MQRFEAPSSSRSSSSEASCSESSNSSSTSTDNEKHQVSHVGKNELLFSQMQTFAGDEPLSKKEMSEYAKNGTSRDRTKQAMANPCKCKAKCGKKIKFAHVVAAATLFWSLPKAGQDSVLWSMQTHDFDCEDSEEESDSSDEYNSSSDSESRSRTPPPHRAMNKWYIQGQEKKTTISISIFLSIQERRFAERHF